MSSEGSAVGRFFRAIGAGIMWIFKDEMPERQTGRKMPDKSRPTAVDDKDEEREEEPEYNPWDEIRDLRMNYFFGSWIMRKFRIVGEDKVKKQLEELEKKREEERKRKEEGGE